MVRLWTLASDGLLSAVTVTTLGFGDVTPVTGAARAVVALEAVLGLVMIGLFVNATPNWGHIGDTLAKVADPRELEIGDTSCSLEPTRGLEPRTPSLRVKCSTS